MIWQVTKGEKGDWRCTSQEAEAAMRNPRPALHVENNLDQMLK
jgi:hypothetical protein